jgi:hypothetical protein
LEDVDFLNEETHACAHVQLPVHIIQLLLNDIGILVFLHELDPVISKRFVSHEQEFLDDLCNFRFLRIVSNIVDL